MCEDIFCFQGNRITSYVVFTFANHCMPTLFKVKPSSLITFHKRYIQSENDFYKSLETEVKKFGCNYELLYIDEAMYYVLVYYEPLLNEVLNRLSNNSILKSNGYLQNEIHYNIHNFKLRFYRYMTKSILEFPHEVGIFLGYPILDVEDYIKNNGENYVLCGYWKVYHNANEAGETFRQFKELRDMAINLFYSGRDLCELEVRA